MLALLALDALLALLALDALLAFDALLALLLDLLDVLLVVLVAFVLLEPPFLFVELLAILFVPPVLRFHGCLHVRGLFFISYKSIVSKKIKNIRKIDCIFSFFRL